MDNVLNHSGCSYGFVMGQIFPKSQKIDFCIFDTGVGIRNSFLESGNYSPADDISAIKLAIQQNTTRDTHIGQGNGLWGLSRIVESGKGQYSITSGNASLFWGLGDIKELTNKDLPCGLQNSCTLVDFQLDYSSPINITKALNGYEPQSLWVEELEDDSDEDFFRISVHKTSESVATRKSGKALRLKIQNLAKNYSKRIILDFSDVSVISSSFADELVAKTVAEIGFAAFTNLFQITSANPIVSGIINHSVYQRMSEKL